MFNARRSIYTGADGRYSFRSIMPRGHGFAPYGTTQARSAGQGRHTCMFAGAPGDRRLAMQIDIDGDACLWGDFFFARCPRVAPERVRVPATSPRSRNAAQASRSPASMSIFHW